MTDPRRQLGRWGETLAARRLQAAGYRIVERNYRCPAGEMDLVTSIGDQWIFLEVKTRRGDAHGLPEDAITPAKAARLLTIAESYLQAHGLVDVDWRVDLFAIELDAGGRLLRTEQIENAVTGW